MFGSGVVAIRVVGLAAARADAAAAAADRRERGAAVPPADSRGSAGVLPGRAAAGAGRRAGALAAAGCGAVRVRAQAELFPAVFGRAVAEERELGAGRGRTSVVLEERDAACGAEEAVRRR